MLTSLHLGLLLLLASAIVYAYPQDNDFLEDSDDNDNDPDDVSHRSFPFPGGSRRGRRCASGRTCSRRRMGNPCPAAYSCQQGCCVARHLPQCAGKRCTQLTACLPHGPGCTCQPPTGGWAADHDIYNPRYYGTCLTN